MTTSAAAATLRTPVFPRAFRAKQYLLDNGIQLADLVRYLGLSKSTWSMFLNGQRDPAGDPFGDVERLLASRGVAVPVWLWAREDGSPALRINGQPVRAGSNITEEGWMERQYLSEGARKALTLFVNPFDDGALIQRHGPGNYLDSLYESATSRAITLRLVQIVTRMGFAGVYGEAGTGKSTVLEAAMRRAADLSSGEIKRVGPPNIERRKMTAVHIMSELIRQLGGDEAHVPRTANIRDSKVISLLKQYHEADRPVVLTIDEAQDLPPETLLDLKRLHEVQNGFASLVAILLVGRPGLRDRLDSTRNLQLQEVSLRCHLLELPPFTEKGEIRAYASARFAWGGDRGVDSVFHASAFEEMERNLIPGEGARTARPLVVNNVCTAAMNRAHYLGELGGDKRVLGRHVADLWTAKRGDLQKWGLQ